MDKLAQVLGIIVGIITIVSFLFTLFKIAKQLGQVIERLDSNIRATSNISTTITALTEKVSEHDTKLNVHDTKLADIKEDVDGIKILVYKTS